MNISTVNELIQSLESAGELSIKERKYLDIMRWAVGVAGERDAALNAERVWKTAMMEVCGEDGPASVASEIRSLQALRDTAMQALKSQIEQLAAENVELKNVFSQKEIPSEAVDAFMETAVMDHDWNETSEWSWVENETEVIHAVLDALKPETPATDRIYAGIKAEGVEQYAALFADTVNMEREHNQQFHKGTLWFAKQLREGGDK